MYHIKYPFLISFFSLFWIINLTSQNIWRNTTVIGGFALGEQDRRLFEFPSAERILAQDPKQPDYDLTLYLDKRLVKWQPLEISAGIGYAENNTSFGRPYEHAVLDGVFTEELRFLGRYKISKLIVPVLTRLHLGKMYLQISALPAFAIRKGAVDSGKSDRRYTKWQLTWNSLEIQPGLGFQFSQRLQISVSYRWYYLHEIDSVIFNSLLFNERDPELLQQKAETYNPFKMWLMVGYKLKNK